MKLTKLLMSILLGNIYALEIVWRKINFDLNKLGTTTYNEYVDAKHLNQCLRRCFDATWCLLACWNQKHCLMSNVIVSGNYVENRTGASILPCYTKKVSDLVVGKKLMSFITITLTNVGCQSLETLFIGLKLI